MQNESILRTLTDSLVSIVMRTVGGRPREIRRALASVQANTWRPVEVVIVYQGTDAAELEMISGLSGEFPALPLRVVQNTGSGDRRSENLNIGWEQAAGRYLAFLDDDDSLGPQHLSLLVAALQGSGQAWAYSQITLRSENENLDIVSETRPFRRHRFSVVDLWRENFIPIHSMLIDRSRLVHALRHRPINEELDRSEDWDFLIRLGFYHQPAVVDEFTCTYHVSTGVRNTNLSLMTSGQEAAQERNRQAWARCKALIEQRKAELLAPLWWASEHFGDAAAATVPAADALAAAGGEAIVPQAVVEKPSFRRRVVRKLIRILERVL